MMENNSTMSIQNRLELSEISFSDDDAEEDFSVNHTDFDELLDEDKPIVISSDDSEDETGEMSHYAHPSESLSGVSPLILDALINYKTLKVDVKNIKRHNGMEIDIPDSEKSKKLESLTSPQPSRLKKRSRRRDARNPDNGSKDDEGFVDSHNLSFPNPLSQSTPVGILPSTVGTSSSKSIRAGASSLFSRSSMFELRDPESSVEESSSSNSKTPLKKKERNLPDRRISIFDVGLDDYSPPIMKDPLQETAGSSPDLLMSFGSPKKAILKNFDIKVVQRKNFDKYPNALKQLRRILKRKHLDDRTDELGEDDVNQRRRKDPLTNIKTTYFKQRKATSEKRTSRSKSKYTNKTKRRLVPNDDNYMDFPENSDDYVVTVPQPFKYGEIVNEVIGSEDSIEEGSDVKAAVASVSSEEGDDLSSMKGSNNNLEEVIDNFVTNLLSQNQIEDKCEEDVTPTPCLDDNQEVEMDDIFKQMEAMHAESEPIVNPERESDLSKQPIDYQTLDEANIVPKPVQSKQTFKIPKLKGTAAELKKSRNMPAQILNDAKERLSKRIEDEMKKIVFRNPDGKSNEFDVDYSEEELADKNDEGWKELHELETDSERLKYFRKKFGNFQSHSPNINLSFHGFKRNAYDENEGPNEFKSLFEHLFSVENKSGKYKDGMTLNVFYERNKEHMMEMFKSRQDDPSNDTIVLMAHYLKHFTVSSMENKEFWEFYSNNKEIPRDQLSLSMSTEDHLDSYNSIYGGGDDLHCAGCDRSHGHRIPPGT